VNSKISELETRLLSTTDSERKVELMNALAWELRHTDLARATVLCESAIELASQNSGEPSQEHLADSYYQLGDLNTQLGSYDQALSHLSRALALYETLGKSHRSAKVLHLIGNTWAHLGNYADALHYFVRLLEIYQDMDLKNEQAGMLSNIGNTYWYLQDFPKALAYLNRSLQISQQTGDKSEQADALENSCNVYCSLGQFDKALKCGLASVQLYEELGTRQGVAKALNGVGEAYKALGDHARALTCYHRSLAISRELGLRYEVSLVLQKIGDVYLDQDQPAKALASLREALSIAEEISSGQRLLEVHWILARVYKLTGNLGNALDHLEKHYELKEQLFNEEADKRVKTLEITHQVETARKEAEIHQLRNVVLEREITERKQAEEALQLTNVQLQQEIAEREQLIADLDAFAHTVAHDLKTPVSIITGHSALILDDRVQVSREQIIEWVGLIEQTGLKMIRIIDGILFLASVRQREIVPHRLDMNLIVEEVEKRLAPMIAQHNAVLTKPYEWPEAWGFGVWIEEVWVNYIANAIKYGGDPPLVELGVTALDNEAVKFWVHDNGAGLSQEEQDQLFAPFTRLNQARSMGHGLGLSIVKRIAEKLGGTVGVESRGEPGLGSTFSFTLPAVKPGQPQTAG
jgi:signal transduction histidine kinase